LFCFKNRFLIFQLVMLRKDKSGYRI